MRIHTTGAGINRMEPASGTVLDDIITPYVTLPAQSDFARHDEPERVLWAAVIQDAVECSHGRIHGCNKYAPQSRIRAEAVAWLASDDYTVGSFRWACDHIGIDSQAVRARLPELSAVRVYQPRYARRAHTVAA